MKLGCRTMWKTDNLNGFSPVVTVRAITWIPPTAGPAGERAGTPAPRHGREEVRDEVDPSY